MAGARSGFFVSVDFAAAVLLVAVFFRREEVPEEGLSLSAVDFFAELVLAGAETMVTSSSAMARELKAITKRPITMIIREL